MKREFNSKEKELIHAIRVAERYVEGELELNCEEDGWYARDYKECFSGSFALKNKEYDKPLITFEHAEKHNVDVRACCDYCGIWHVG